MKIYYLLLLGSMITFSSCEKKAKIVYPETAKGNTVDTYFGVEVADPYRWLENDTSAETAAWVKAQNEVTLNYLKQKNIIIISCLVVCTNIIISNILNFHF